MTEFPDDIKKDAEEAVSGFVGWIEGGNTTASLSEHAVAGLKHSFASAILAERNRCAVTARETKLYDGDLLKNSDPRLTVAQAIMKGDAA